jgi:hypothetical protein
MVDPKKSLTAKTHHFTLDSVFIRTERAFKPFGKFNSLLGLNLPVYLLTQ